MNKSDRGRKRSKDKSHKNIFEKKITNEKFSNIKETPIKVHEAYRTTNRLY